MVKDAIEYKKEALHQLSDDSTYCKLKDNPTVGYKKVLSKLIKGFV